MIPAKFPKIKLVTKNQIRLVHCNPTSFDDLQLSISSLINKTNFSLSYDEGKVIQNDFDLSESLKWAKNKPSLKIHLELLSYPQCSVCSFTLNSSLFHCQDCKTFYCYLCESIQPHPHLLIKAQNFDQILKGTNPAPNFKSLLKELRKYEKSLIKLKVVKHLLDKNFCAKPGDSVQGGWVVQNNGELDWSEGWVLISRAGELRSENKVFGELKVKEEMEILLGVRVPEYPGVHSGTWEVLVRGIPVTKLKMKIKTV